MAEYPAGLRPNLTPGARIEQSYAQTWRLEIPAGPAGRYRLAQLDDYAGLPRRSFLYSPPFQVDRLPVHLELEARASAANLPGTWGFGLWNDPFSMAILSGGGLLRLPALPQTAWFFFASPPGYLSLRDDLPAQGWLASVFRSPGWPAALLAPGLLGLPLLLLPAAVRLLRRLGRRIVRQAAAALELDPTAWHHYSLDWQADRVAFQVDGQAVLVTPLAPRGPLGLVTWIDNQYLALPPDGRIRYGALANSAPAWIELRGLQAR